MSRSLSLIYSTFGSGEEARRIARTLLQEKLVACANHLAPIFSQYEFRGAFHEEQEFPLLLKTASDLVKPATDRLLVLHTLTRLPSSTGPSMPETRAMKNGCSGKSKIGQGNIIPVGKASLLLDLPEKQRQ